MYSTSHKESQVAKLRRQIAATELQLRDLKGQLISAEKERQAAEDLSIAYGGGMPHEWQAETMAVLSQWMPNESHERPIPLGPEGHQWPLANEEYQRYGRQLIMPEVGLQGQLRLKQAKVLIVGAGGLGCPAAAYLAGAGVGTIGLIDGDTVEVSNLHRQIAHSTSRVGMSKVESAIQYFRGLNPNPQYIAHPTHLIARDSLDIIQSYDLVLDCTDHPTSRYLISDACVLTGKPLVSASALRTEGQLMVLNNAATSPGDPTGGPCYRCVFPKPPPAESVISCGEGGILGPVVGVMGVLQALEALKLIVGASKSAPETETPCPTLLMFSAFSSPQFRSVRLRSRRQDCAVCSSKATITPSSLSSGSLDYAAFCGMTNPVSILSEDERISPERYVNESQNTQDVALVDVRDATQFELSNVPGSINVPWADFPALLKEARNERPEWLKKKDIVVVCKFGNDSQLAVKMIKDSGAATGNVVDIKGGFRAWREQIDPSWPDY